VHARARACVSESGARSWTTHTLILPPGVPRWPRIRADDPPSSRWFVLPISAVVSPPRPRFNLDRLVRASAYLLDAARAINSARTLYSIAPVFVIGQATARATAQVYWTLPVQPRGDLNDSSIRGQGGTDARVTFLLPALLNKFAKLSRTLIRRR